MNKKVLYKLEYNKIISLLSSNCVTYIGKEIAEKLLPSNDIETVQMLQTETKQLCERAPSCFYFCSKRMAELQHKLCELSEINKKQKHY